ncbi:MAG: hypothetical protein ACREUW_04750 [Burkholderiales bacterium]
MILYPEKIDFLRALIEDSDIESFSCAQGDKLQILNPGYAKAIDVDQVTVIVLSHGVMGQTGSAEYVTLEH